MTSHQLATAVALAAVRAGRPGRALVDLDIIIPAQRRRTDTQTNHGIPSASLWVATRGWGRVS